MPALADRVKESTTTTGNGTLTLDGAATGFQSFSAAFGNGVSVYYVIAGGSEWEVGIGTTGAGTLSRDTVLQSSNADAKVVFSAGTKDVFCSYVADRAVTTVDSATLTNKTISGASNTLTNIPNSATTATSASTNSAIVSRDANGSSSFKNVKLDGTTSGTVTVQPAATAGTWALTLPTTAGTAGQVLSTNGSGVTSWASVGSPPQSVKSTTKYAVQSSDANSQLIYTGSTSGQFYFDQTQAGAMVAGNTITATNDTAYNLTFGGATAVDSTYAGQTLGGAVRGMLRQTDGKIIVFGTFSTPYSRAYRLNTDGTIDTTWLVSFDGGITAMDQSADGNFIYVAGQFTTVTDTVTAYSRFNLVKLNTSNGSVVSGWNAPTPSSYSGSPIDIASSTNGAQVAVCWNATNSIGNFQLLFFSGTNGAQITGPFYNSDPFRYWLYNAPTLVERVPGVAQDFFLGVTGGIWYTDDAYNSYRVYNSFVRLTTSGVVADAGFPDNAQYSPTGITPLASGQIGVIYNDGALRATSRTYNFSTSGFNVTLAGGVYPCSMSQRSTDNFIAVTSFFDVSFPIVYRLLNASGVLQTIANVNGNNNGNGTYTAATTDGRWIISNIADLNPVTVGRLLAVSALPQQFWFNRLISGAWQDAIATETFSVVAGATMTVQKLPSGRWRVTSKTC